MTNLDEAPIALYIPGLGWFSTTAEGLTAGLRRGAEQLRRTGGATLIGGPDGETPVLSPVLRDAEGMEAVTGVGASWWESAARRGEIPTVHFGRWVRFDLDDVLTHARKVGLKRLVGVEHRATDTPTPPLRTRRA